MPVTTANLRAFLDQHRPGANRTDGRADFQRLRELNLENVYIGRRGEVHVSNSGVMRWFANLTNRATGEEALRQAMANRNIPESTIDYAINYAIENTERSSEIALEEFTEDDQRIGEYYQDVVRGSSADSSSLENSDRSTSLLSSNIKSSVEYVSDSEAQTAEHMKEFLTKSKKTDQERTQVIDDFLTACSLKKENLTTKIEEILVEIENMAEIDDKNKVTDEQRGTLAQRILNECIYGSFNYWSPDGYDNLLKELDLPAHMKTDGDLSFRNTMPVALTAYFTEEFNKTNPSKPGVEIKNNGNHYDVEVNKAKISIPDDGVCLFAACLYGKYSQ